MARRDTSWAVLVTLGGFGALGCGIAKHDSVPEDPLPPDEPACVYEGRRHPVLEIFPDSSGNYCRCEERVFERHLCRWSVQDHM